MRLLLLLCMLIPLTSVAKVKVVASIPALQQITRVLMAGIGEPELLIDQRLSAHHFAFKPSHFRLLQDADLVIWVDRQFESGFQRLPEILREHTEALELLPRLGLQQQDGHIWYAPTLLPRIVEQIRLALTRVDPQNSARYNHNALVFTDAITAWEKTTRQQLTARKPLYLLDHDFLSHFERDLGLQPVAVLHDSREQQVGIRELRRIEQLLTSGAAKCLLINEAGPSKLASNLARKFQLKIVNITLTESTGESADLIQSLEHLSDTLAACI